jgi:hypothetical protein
MTNQEQIALIKKNPISVACAVLALLVGGGIYFRSGEIPAAEAELTQKSAEAERLSLNIASSAQLKEQHESIVAANKSIDAGIIRASQLGDNTQFFYKLAADTDVKIVDLRQTTGVLAKPAKSNFAPVGFSVSVQGSLPQILDFLRGLENGDHYTRVLTTSVSGNVGQRSNPLTLALNLEILGLP